jgi:integrase
MPDEKERLEPTAEGFRTRLRYGKGLRGRFLITLHDEAAAEKRAIRMRELATALARAGHSARAPIILEEAGKAPTERDFAEAVRIAEALCAGKGTAPKLRPTKTVQDLGDDWTSGRLARDWPDQVRKKRTADDDKSRFENYVYPVIGSKKLVDVTLDDAEEVMRRLPEGLSPLTRRGIGALLARLLKLAVYPLRLIPASPIPAGFLPQRGQRKALGYLYPDEDRRLLECGDVPFAFRLLWGFLMREGMREGEAMGLTWADLDLQRGAVRLDKNKTDDPRAWALDVGTAEALRLYRERFRADAEATALVFVDPTGKPHTKFGAAALLRSHLKAVGLEQERPELFESTPERRRIRVHDLRGTFVTIALANGRSEAWISDRTGHRSSAMIAKYKRTSRTFGELGLGALTPLVDALPELRPTAGWAKSGPAIANQARKPASPTGFEPVLQP